MVSMIKKNLRPKRWRLARWRTWIQAGFLLVWLNPAFPFLQGFCGPVFHCYSCPLAAFACPIGILANYSALHIVPLLAIGTLLAFGAAFGTLICGWACPFGFLQDLLGRIPVPKIRLPAACTWLRFAVLVGLVIVVPYFWEQGKEEGAANRAGQSEEHWFFICRLCPAGALEASVPYSIQQTAATKTIVWPTPAKSVILIAFFLTAIFIWRPWCTLLCPLGAIFSLCNYVSLSFLQFRPSQCNDCDRCRDLCKLHAPGERRGSDLRCIRCLECNRCQALSIATVFQPAQAEEETREMANQE
jgi:ferredoxin-type protein NapH